MALDPRVWGPHYWFTLHTIAYSYPLRPNDVIKKKYYDFMQNLPLFLPVPAIGNSFAELLDKFPVTPYLDSRASFIKWMHFIHNKINEQLKLPQISLDDALSRYHALYKPKIVANEEQRRWREKCVFTGLVIGSLLIAVLLYRSWCCRFKNK